MKYWSISNYQYSIYVPLILKGQEIIFFFVWGEIYNGAFFLEIFRGGQAFFGPKIALSGESKRSWPP
jgi:hypothetical protein